MVRELFKKYQRELVSFCNTDIGKEMLAKFGAKEARDGAIIKVTPDGFTQLLDIKNDRLIKRSVFHSRSPYIKVFGDVLTMADIAFENYRKIEDPKLLPFVLPHFMGMSSQLKNQLPTILLTTSTFNPDADPESTSVDGNVDRTATESWATKHDAADGDDVNDSAPSQGIPRITDNGSNWTSMRRGFYLFDSSALPDTDNIDSATFEIFATAKADNHSQSVDLITTTPASNTALAMADFDQVGTTLQATSLTVASINASNAYNAWTLNATGLGNISKVGVTKFGTRMSGDTSNSEPTKATASSNVTHNLSDTGSNKPKLVVIHSAAVTFVPTISIF